MNADKIADALREIANAGVKFDHRGNHSQWVVDTAKAALAEYDAQPAQAAQDTREQAIALLQVAIEKIGDVNAVYEKLLAAQPVGVPAGYVKCKKCSTLMGGFGYGEFPTLCPDCQTAQPVGVPDGCVLVPREPTKAMLDAAFDAPTRGHPETGTSSFDDIYRAMLAAAPQPPAQPSADAEDDLPGMWSKSDFTGGDPDERSYAARAAEGDGKWNCDAYSVTSGRNGFDAPISGMSNTAIIVGAFTAEKWSAGDDH